MLRNQRYESTLRAVLIGHGTVLAGDESNADQTSRLT
jgi:hypothetical protein